MHQAHRSQPTRHHARTKEGKPSDVASTQAGDGATDARTPKKSFRDAILSAEKPAALPASSPAEPVRPKKVVGKKPPKKGGKVANKLAAAEEAKRNPAEKPAKKKKKSKDAAANGHDDSETASSASLVPYEYQHPKPAAITSALFMWELVAAFSEPFMVLRLEAVCRDVAGALKASHQGNNLMQRYWNAQWTRLIWAETMVPMQKRLLLPSSLTRSEGRMKWRRMFREEYPLWLKRTFSGVGSDNNATNVAKVLFHAERLNEAMTAEQLKRMELTVEEAIRKAQAKRGVQVKVNNEADTDNDSIQGAVKKAALRGGSGSPTAKGRGMRMPMRDPSDGFTRADYKLDRRQGTRKGKHKKGGDKKWESYAALDDEDDY